jgi:hypothetical protein
MDELKLAVHQGKKRRAPGIDGICLEFYQHTWDTTKHDILKILNHMYINGEILDSQKKGTIVCIPKTSTHSQPSDFRPLTLLNAELKLLLRILASRQKRWLPEIMHPHQFRGTPDNNIYEAFAAIRDNSTL